MKRILFLLFTSVLALQGFAQNADVKAKYENAFNELHQMLRDEAQISFKRAVFITENAYLNNIFIYEDFLRDIDDLTRLTEAVAISDDQYFQNYNYKDRQNVLMSGSIFRVMKDSLFFEKHDKTKAFIKYPFTYDMEDFWGEDDWTKMFVLKLIHNQSGNCHSLPSLYKILADELGVKAYLAIAPNHTYIKQWNDKTGWYNTELTTGQFPFDHDIKFNSYIKTEAIAAGVYMDTLSSKETIAYVLTDLVQGYMRKTGYQDIVTPLNWIEVALEYYPDYVNALILKAEIKKKQYEQLMKENGADHFSALWKDSNMKDEFEALEKSYVKIHETGYRRMPKEMYLNWLFRVQKDTTRKPYYFPTPQPFKNYNYNVQVVTAGNGQNYEFFDQDTLTRIGTIVINRLSGKIKEFVLEDSINKMPDEVISRMYDPALGRWWQIDPYANAYYSYSPYSFVNNNPIIYVDEEGGFKIPIHRRITQYALNRLGLVKRWFRFDLLAGNTIIADIFGAGEDRHFDGRNNFSEVNETWNNLNKEINSASIGNTTWGGAQTQHFGKLLHNVQDFYSHSNYIELFIDWYVEHFGSIPSSTEIPTYDEAVASPAYEDFKKNYLEKNLKTGEFNLGRWIAGNDAKKTNEEGNVHHDQLAKDKRNVGQTYGGTTLHDLAVFVATVHTMNVLSNATGSSANKKKKQPDADKEASKRSGGAH